MTSRNKPKTTLPLAGNRCQCTRCGEYFNHTYGFDRHRVGKHRGRQRRCLLVAEMVAKNFSKNARGFWITESHTAVRIASARRRHSAAEPAEGVGNT
jgi:hypothetical protein